MIRGDEVAPVNRRVRLGGPGGRLEASIGCASASAPGKLNEDFFGIATPGPEALARRGLLLAVADGVSADGRAGAASGAAVRTLLEDFYATPEYWSDARGLDTVMRAANDWIAGENRSGSYGEGAVCTLSSLLLQERGWSVAHVGDSRVYRWHHRRLVPITRDHTWPRRDMRHVLRRAVGLDTHLVMDYAEGALDPGDAFLLVTDGVWEVLGEEEIARLLLTGADPAHVAGEAVARSLARQSAYMGRNDATALMVRVETAPA